MEKEFKELAIDFKELLDILRDDINTSTIKDDRLTSTEVFKIEEILHKYKHYDSSYAQDLGEINQRLVEELEQAEGKLEGLKDDIQDLLDNL